MNGLQTNPLKRKREISAFWILCFSVDHLLWVMGIFYDRRTWVKKENEWWLDILRRILLSLLLYHGKSKKAVQSSWPHFTNVNIFLQLVNLPFQDLNYALCHNEQDTWYKLVSFSFSLKRKKYLEKYRRGKILSGPLNHIFCFMVCTSAELLPVPVKDNHNIGISSKSVWKAPLLWCLESCDFPKTNNNG